MSESESSSISSRIAALAEDVQAEYIYEEARLEALKAARKLLAKLEPPMERMAHDVLLWYPHFMALRMGVQLEIFSQISKCSDTGIHLNTIAEKTQASPILVGQILRLLAATGYVDQHDVENFKPTALTMIMVDPVIEASTRASFDLGLSSTMKAPEFFRKNNNQFPGSISNTPLQLALDTKLTIFEWLGQNPESAKDFQQMMKLRQQVTSNWVEWFDIQRHIIDGSEPRSPENVLLVDIGGGEGHYLRQFSEKFPRAPGRLILQELPDVIRGIQSPPEDVELMPHDFFTPQTIKGARAYFMHWILHDWSDENCHTILAHIADAMKPGYSRLIIHEQILPDMNCDAEAAGMSIIMMVQMGALERTETQWRALLESVGLHTIQFNRAPVSGEGIIEAIK
ncbi:hypothetical protein N7532_010747 [Penicillium argentinense]|uniref:O-methyltransferase C-terminal domain-containing protein n=1 Tax=Penicillium argentinense TaxID=1131581 RepID=A0A9W9EQG8_9EURO|nr:uncharacterized protein N7532_010747 [Penicillium argentinense]KAJ5085976.1 hypothetical protein N7532_010747 [Penicillium argentinense]